MRSSDLFADAALHARDLLKRYLVKFDDTNHTRSAPGLPNHLAWCLGHLALTNNRFCEWLPGEKTDAQGRPLVGLPASDFIDGAASGDSERFGSESVSFGSHPAIPGVVFPKHARCIEIFDASIERFAAAIRKLSDEDLITPVPMFRGVTAPPHLLVARAVYHVGIHNGQIADLRRALGLGTVLG
ncbi:MAG TPA: DinB family protein [Phycisphaerales bacterium]